MATIAWRRVLRLRRRREATGHWWAFVLARSSSAPSSLPPDSAVNAWFLGMLCVSTGLALTTVGVGLAVVRLLTRPAPSALA